MNSACYVYAIVDRAATLPPDLTGLNGEPLSMVPWQALAAVVGASRELRIRPDAGTVLRHETVVETLCEITPTLPVRFGTALADVAAVAETLADRYAMLRTDLARVGDKRELGLTVLWGTVAIPSDLDDETQIAGSEERGVAQGRGTRYLLARRKDYRREQIKRTMAEKVMSGLDQHLRPHIRDRLYTVDTTPGLAIRAAFLVDRGAVADTQDALAECRGLYPALRFLITGPWPPYSFVSSRSPVAREARYTPRQAQPSSASLLRREGEDEDGRS